MAVFRVQLKPSGNGTYHDILEFCRSKEIIGVGWNAVVGKIDDKWALKEECAKLTAKGGVYEGNKGVAKAIEAIRQMQPGDFVWTREGGNIANYYICKVDKSIWKDRIVTDEHIKNDIANFVSCKWAFVGTEDKVPGHIVNSFRASATAQHVYHVDEISKIIWNKYCNPCDKVEIGKLDYDSFWQLIGSEELECIVMLYLQSMGYYIYSSTLKNDTKTYEAVLVSKKDNTKCYPQVKQAEHLNPSDYINGLDEKGKVYLFSSIESYGSEHPQVECLKRNTLWNFINENYEIMPDSVKYWIDIIEENK